MKTIRSESRDIDETISLKDSAKRSAFSAGYRPNDAD